MNWPDGARLAVWLSFDFDAESSWLSRDPKNAKKPGTLSHGVFGAKVGIFSVLEVLQRQGIQGTFFVPGWVAEKYRDTVKTIQDEGHEIGHHGYLHEWIDPDEPEKEREVFHQGLNALVNVTGKQPVGYRSPAAETSANMMDLLIEHDFLYSSNMMDDIRPYFVEKNGKKTALVELPFHWMLVDTPFFRYSIQSPSPISPASQACAVWKEEFHALYQKGGIFTLICHPQYIGRPSRIAMLNDFICFMKTYPDVWFANGETIARYVRHEYPLT